MNPKILLFKKITFIALFKIILILEMSKNFLDVMSLLFCLCSISFKYPHSTYWQFIL